jgi:putative MATE family efflux protein
MRPEPSDGTYRRVLRLALPVVALNVLGVFTLFVDTLFVSRLPESEPALIALSFAGQIVFLAQVPMLGLGVGSAVLVSRAFGAGDLARVAELARQSLQLTLLLGALMAALGPAFLPPLLRALGAEETAYDLALAYLVPLVLGVALYFTQLLSFALFRSTGNTAIPLYVGLLVNALNVVLDAVLIFGLLGAPRLGVVGAAYGTLVSQGVGVLLTLWLFSRGALGGAKVPLAPSRIEGAFARDMGRLGAPAALDLFLVNVSFLSMVYFLGRIDALAVAAHGIGQRVQSIAFVPGLGIAQAVGALVGNALGAHDVDEARAVTRAGIVLATGMMGTLGLVLTLARALVASAFNLEPSTPLYEYTLTWITILGASLPLLGVNIGLIGALRGSGATVASFFINVVATLIFQIPLQATFAFALGWGAVGVWLAFPLTYILRIALAVSVYRRGTWARVGLAA